MTSWLSFIISVGLKDLLDVPSTEADLTSTRILIAHGLFIGSEYDILQCKQEQKKLFVRT